VRAVAVKGLAVQADELVALGMGLSQAGLTTALYPGATASELGLRRDTRIGLASGGLLGSPGLTTE
jgi:hypothetical protein